MEKGAKIDKEVLEFTKIVLISDKPQTIAGLSSKKEVVDGDLIFVISENPKLAEKLNECNGKKIVVSSNNKLREIATIWMEPCDVWFIQQLMLSFNIGIVGFDSSDFLVFLEKHEWMQPIKYLGTIDEIEQSIKKDFREIEHSFFIMEITKQNNLEQVCNFEDEMQDIMGLFGRNVLVHDIEKPTLALFIGHTGRKETVFLYRNLLEDALRQLARKTKDGNMIATESDLKCYLYSLLKEILDKKHFFVVNQQKYSRLLTEVEYLKGNIADLIMVAPYEIEIDKEGDFELKDKLNDSIVIELKFRDWHQKSAKIRCLKSDCTKILSSENIRKAAVVLYDTDKEEKDKLFKKDLEQIRHDLIGDKSQYPREIILYYINGPNMIIEYI
jgi:hypothetical protein